jgi:antitoxin component of MazEF toxin-antitoxin module
LSAKDGELVVKPSIPARLSLDDLLAEVSEENLHSSIDTGSGSAPPSGVTQEVL